MITEGQRQLKKKEALYIVVVFRVDSDKEVPLTSRRGVLHMR